MTKQKKRNNPAYLFEKEQKAKQKAGEGGAAPPADLTPSEGRGGREASSENREDEKDQEIWQEWEKWNQRLMCFTLSSALIGAAVLTAVWRNQRHAQTKGDGPVPAVSSPPEMRALSDEELGQRLLKREEARRERLRGPRDEGKTTRGR